MKKSISYLPKHKQDDLHYLVKAVLEKIPQTEMIILYGSYARNDYVEFDQRQEFGITTTYMSDYDILVVTSGTSDKSVGNKLESIDHKYYEKSDTRTPVQFINEDIKELNKQLEEGRYFYSEIKKDGVLLYDSGRCKLVRRRKLNFKEIQQQAQEYFDVKFHSASVFLKNAIFNYDIKEYKTASFMLHQACENYYYAINLVFTQQNSKQHNLSKLQISVKKYSDELSKIFIKTIPEDKRLFKLVKSAYVEARYNPDFVVTKEDIDALIPKVEKLGEITKRICEQRIKEYGEME
ncbi:MAG: HEPN domain-containing protein [Dysgonomonas sp.]|nr:HEPN domain-containing protein [Dysgonomonas sp.]